MEFYRDEESKISRKGIFGVAPAQATTRSGGEAEICFRKTGRTNPPKTTDIVTRPTFSARNTDFRAAITANPISERRFRSKREIFTRSFARTVARPPGADITYTILFMSQF